MGQVIPSVAWLPASEKMPMMMKVM